MVVVVVRSKLYSTSFKKIVYSLSYGFSSPSPILFSSSTTTKDPSLPISDLPPGSVVISSTKLNSVRKRRPKAVGAGKVSIIPTEIPVEIPVEIPSNAVGEAAILPKRRRRKSGKSGAIAVDHTAVYLERLTKLGMSEEQARRILAEHAVLCPAEEWLSKMELLLERGCTRRQVRHILEKGALSSGSSRKLREVLDFLGSIDLSGEQAGKMLARAPFFSKLCVQTLGSRVSFLKAHGFDPERMKVMLQRHPRLLGFSPEALQERWSFFETLGLRSEHILKILHRCPELFSRSVENTLQRFFDRLESRGLVKDVALTWMVRKPHALQLSDTAVVEKLDLLEHLGFDENARQMTKGFFIFSTYSSKLLRERIDWFVSQGLSESTVRNMLRVNPAVLTTPTEKVTRITSYVSEYLNYNLDALIRVSVVFHLSAENRILPRCKLVADLKEKGILKDPISLSITLLSTNENFEKYILAKRNKLL